MADIPLISGGYLDAEGKFSELSRSIPLFTGGALEEINAFLRGQQREWGTYYEANLNSVNEVVRNFQNNIEVNVSNDFSAINSRLDAILAALQSSTKAGVDAPRNELTRIITLGQQQVSTNIVPVIGQLEALSRGAKGFGDIPIATSLAIMGSIPWSFDLIQASNLDSIRSGVKSLLDASLGGAAGIIDAVQETSSGLLGGIASLINQALATIGALILDPLAALLRAILAAIEGLPRRTIQLAIEVMLSEAPPGLAGA